MLENQRKEVLNDHFRFEYRNGKFCCLDCDLEVSDINMRSAQLHRDQIHGEATRWRHVNQKK